MVLIAPVDFVVRACGELCGEVGGQIVLSADEDLRMMRRSIKAKG